jgi:hypothetical protein
MPPPGWYEDPEQPWTWRYFDGAYWTEHRAPMRVPPVRDPTSLSIWFERSVAAGKVAVRRVGLVLVALWLVIGAAGWWLIVASFDSARGRELRRLFGSDENPLVPAGSPELTDAEAERAWELIQDLFWSALPWIVLLAFAGVVASAWSVALVAQAVQHRSADSPEAAQPAIGSVIAAAIRRVPAVVASGVVVVAVHGAAWALGALGLLVVALLGGGTAAIALTAIFVVPPLVGVTVWLWGRLTLATVIAAAGGHGIGVRRSWDMTQGRFWFVVARLLMAGLIAGVAGGVANAASGFGQFFGLAVFVAIVFLSHAVAAAAAIVVTTCGHLAAVDQVAIDRPQ